MSSHRIAVVQHGFITDSLDVDWSDLVGILSDCTETPCSPCTGKDCRYKKNPSGDDDNPKGPGGDGWSPTALVANPKKAANGFIRKMSENVESLSLLVLDVDHTDAVAEQKITTALKTDARGGPYNFVFHSTHNHRKTIKDGKPVYVTEGEGAYRIGIPTSRPVPASQWKEFWTKAVAYLDIPADATCISIERMYFLPTRPEGSPPYEFAHVDDQKPLDVDAIMGTTVPQVSLPAVAPVAASAPAPAAQATSEPQTPASLEDLRNFIANARRKHAGTDPQEVQRHAVLDRVLRGEPLAAPSKRDNTVQQAASLIIFAVPIGSPIDALVEIMRPSIMAMDAADRAALAAGKNVDVNGVDHWLARAKDCLERAVLRREQIEEERKINAAKREHFHKVLKAYLDSKKPKVEGAEPPATTVNNEEITDAYLDEHWADTLINNKKGELHSCTHNAMVILSLSPECRNTLRYDKITNNIVAIGGQFDGSFNDMLVQDAKNWLQAKYEIFLKTNEVLETLAHLTRKYTAFNPVQEYLLSLEWDGTARVDDFLTRYCGATTTDGLERDITSHLHNIGRKWLLSAVARAFANEEEGEQVDTVLVLEGEQGIRKSSALRVLGGRWYAEMQSATMGDKDSRMLAGCSWIIELAELASFRKSDTEAAKAFISAKKDKFRPPYGHGIQEFTRHGVFVGTTNSDNYLNDDTGNRRYWTVHCKKIDIVALRADRDQLWAEAYALFKAAETCPECAKSDHGRCVAHRWWLENEEATEAEMIAEQRSMQSITLDQIAEWWYAMPPEKRPAWVRLTDVIESVLKVPVDRMRGVDKETCSALKRMGFQRKKVWDGRSLCVWVANDVLRSAPQALKPRHLRLVANAPIAHDVQ